MLASLESEQVEVVVLLYSLRASKARGFWHFVLCCDYVATLAEQSAPFALMSKLLDANWLDYLRRRAMRDGAEEGKSFLLRQKEKHGTPVWVFRVFGGEERI